MWPDVVSRASSHASVVVMWTTTLRGTLPFEVRPGLKRRTNYWKCFSASRCKMRSPHGTSECRLRRTLWTSPWTYGDAVESFLRYIASEPEWEELFDLITSSIDDAAKLLDKIPHGLYSELGWQVSFPQLETLLQKYYPRNPAQEEALGGNSPQRRDLTHTDEPDLIPLYSFEDDLPSRWIRPYFLQSPILTKLCFVRFLHVFLLRTQFFMCCMFLLWCTTFWCHGFFMSCCLTSCLRVSVFNSRFLKFACGCKTRLTCPPSNVPISFQVCRCSHMTDLPPLSSLAASAASKRNFFAGLSRGL